MINGSKPIVKPYLDSLLNLNCAASALIDKMVMRPSNKPNSLTETSGDSDHPKKGTNNQEKRGDQYVLIASE